MSTMSILTTVTVFRFRLDRFRETPIGARSRNLKVIRCTVQDLG